MTTHHTPHTTPHRSATPFLPIFKFLSPEQLRARRSRGVVGRVVALLAVEVVLLRLMLRPGAVVAGADAAGLGAAAWLCRG